MVIGGTFQSRWRAGGVGKPRLSDKIVPGESLRTCRFNGLNSYRKIRLFKIHPDESWGPEALKILDSCFRRNDVRRVDIWAEGLS